MIRAIAHFLPMPCLACQTCLRHVSFCAILAIKIAPPPKTLPQGRRCIIICHDDVRAEGLTAALNDLHAEAKKDQQLAMFVDGRCVWWWGQWGVPSCVEGCSSAMVWINFAAQRGYIYMVFIKKEAKSLVRRLMNIMWFQNTVGRKLKLNLFFSSLALCPCACSTPVPLGLRILVVSASGAALTPEEAVGFDTFIMYGQGPSSHPLFFTAIPIVKIRLPISSADS